MVKYKLSKGTFLKVGGNMKADIKREEMLDAFIEAFTEYGIDKASTKKLTAKAGVNEALLYYYFADKNEAVIACVKRCYERYKTGTLDIFRKNINDVEKMMERLQAYTKKTMAEQRFALEVLAHPTYSKNILPSVIELNRELERDIRQYARDNGKDEELLVTWIQIVTESLVYYAITKNDENFARKKPFIIEEIKKILE